MGDRLLIRLAAAFAGLSALLVLSLTFDEAAYVVVAGVAVGGLGLAASACMWFNAGSRFCVGAATAVGLAVATVAATLLVTIVGLPGGAPRPFDGAASMLIAFGIAVPALVAAERSRHSDDATPGPPYAV